MMASIKGESERLLSIEPSMAKKKTVSGTLWFDGVFDSLLDHYSRRS